MARNEPRFGTGRFQWRAGGWFGAQLGGTAWLLASGLILLPKNLGAGLVGVACFVLPNLIGSSLYASRRSLAPYPALQTLLLIVGLFSFGFIMYLNRVGLVAEIDPQLAVNRWGFYLVPLLFGGLMVGFHLAEKRPRGR